MRKQSKWFYKGPVKLFGDTINRCWEGVTWAPSEKKALSNLSYQYKNNRGFVPGTRIVLNPDYLIEISALNSDYEYYDEQMKEMINSV